MSIPLFGQSIHDVAKATGIEESVLRFLESQFADLLGPPSLSLAGGIFDQKKTGLLCRIHQLLFKERIPPSRIRHILDSESGARRKNRRVIAVTSGKGGVGKTTVAINLAIASAMSGCKVLLLDADLGLANAHLLAGIHPGRSLQDVISGRLPLREAIAQGPGGIALISGGSGQADLASLAEPALLRLTEELRLAAGEYDLLIIDTGAGISPQVLHFLNQADDLVIVATPNIASILDAYGVVKTVHEQGMTARPGLLINQAGDSAQAHAVFENINACAQRFLGSAPIYLGHLYRDPAVESACQARQPYLLRYPQSQNAGLLLKLARRFHTDSTTAHQTPQGKRRVHTCT
ncbi:MAG: P-loop NTPase [Lentisphaerota bacterium]